MDWTLAPFTKLTPRPGPLLVIVMDGIGVGRGDKGDAVTLARTPVLDWLYANCPTVQLKAHGRAVGLPSDGDMGNSEVGHNALGAGRVFDQGAKLVAKAIADQSIFTGQVWKDMVEQCRERKSAFHLIGLLSDGNVHSHQDHLHAIIARAAAEGVSRLFVHPLLDGRDVSETSALSYLALLETELAKHHDQDGRCYRIASGGGRMVTTMDRYEADWSIVERGWKAHVHGEGRPFASAREAVETYRNEDPGVIDQFLPEFVIATDGVPVGPIQDDDCVVFFNFRGDRAIEISKAFERDDFSFFDRGRRPNVLYAGMMQYDGDEHVPQRYLVSPPKIEHTFGEYLARNGIAQFACSETQKYGHVTYFWNGNRSGMFDPNHEEYVEVPSDRVPFDQRPWMKAAEITDTTIPRLQTGTFRFGRINYANGDMVGHTGNRRAAMVGIETVDLSLGRLLEAVRIAEGVALITADHGNSDEMFERDKQGRFSINPDTGRPRPRTSHSLNPVAFTLYDPVGLQELTRTLSTPPPGIGYRMAARDSAEVRQYPIMPLAHPWSLEVPEGGGGLANVAATCLNLLGFAAPEQFEPSLLRVKR